MYKIYKSLFTHRYLLIGDILVLALITVTGFAMHGESTNFIRMLSTFIPLLFSWFFIAPFFNLFYDEYFRKPDQLWRVLWAMMAVVPLAAWLRALWINSPVIPIFVLVLLGTSALAMIIWRSLLLISLIWSKPSNG